MRKVNKIILHCAAANIVDKDLFAIVNQWHLNRGWSGCGYHYLIRKDGGIILGRNVSKEGAHCKGQNHDSIGIMLNGDRKFTHKQFLSLAKLCYNLIDIFDLKESDIYGHNYYTDKKTCPNFRVEDFLSRYMLCR